MKSLADLANIRVLIIGLYMNLPFIGFSQNCVCPENVTCGACSGGLVTLTLRYDGLSAATITVLDNMGQLFNSSVNPGGIISVNGSLPNGKFQGSQIEIEVNDVLNTTIHANCSGSPVLVGDVYGLFTVMGGASLSGGALCCSSVVVDAIHPTISNCPPDMEVALEVGQCNKAVSWPAPTATDNCELSSLTVNYASGSTFPIGDTEVIYTAVDVYGNASTCKFKVSVLKPGPPKVTGCPENITEEEGEEGEAIVNWEEPQVFSCGTLSVSKSHEPGSSFPVGTTIVTYTFTDEFGSDEGCSFEVIVMQKEYPFEISKALTPDGDGINDVWIITNIEKFASNKVVITDRWGNAIFSASGYNNGNVVWDGRNKKGELVATGTYYFSIQVDQPGSGVTHKKGFVEVVR